MLKTLVLTLGVFVGYEVSAETLPADPTRPSATMAVSATSLQQDYRLTSLITGKHTQLAVINGQRVQVGDQLEDARVVAINKNGVRLEIRGEQKFISLSERSGFSKVKSQK